MMLLLAFHRYRTYTHAAMRLEADFMQAHMRMPIPVTFTHAHIDTQSLFIIANNNIPRGEIWTMRAVDRKQAFYY